ncbi:RagB/SusD family nutrient uptake outer membrane protein [Chitinophaga arvensicola]|uniref:SusD family protein n=1 Tax=Chitinophaga arvensicola TaxID=29529 RepID=A0A1I0S778_9BACT|nr:RagB/SusD family nutrient uptake outer membrane protein [Chitinophaga arvensicola]SEW51597.1 SusD family protein [Chitinophaga arvensicola]
MLIQKMFLTTFFILVCCCCSKSAFLDKKPNTNIVIPSTLDDMTQLLDNQDVFSFCTPASGIMSADEYYYPTQESFDAVFSKTEKNCFTWNKDIYGGEKEIPEWNAPYKAIFYSNVVLEGWEKLSNGEKESEKGAYVKAWALFNRSYNYFNLVQAFALPYDQATASSDLGVPLKLTADINDVQKRATVQETYDRIISDLEASIKLFTIAISSKNLNRPSRSAGFALLARVYNYMRNYDKSLQAADSSLSIYSTLIDYNTLDPEAYEPFTNYNTELVYYSITNTTYQAVTVNSGSSTIDTALVGLYDQNDLRKAIFFNVDKENYSMRSGYNGIGGYPFTGLAVDEVYLLKAEGQARAGSLDAAKSTLNSLLINRYKTGTYKPMTGTSKTEILNAIVSERRKELIWRGLRWSDIKRLNKEGANITLKRVIGSTVFTLAPNDPRYVMPIPDDEISLSHIQQNLR